MLLEITITTNYRIEKGIAPIVVNILFGLTIISYGNDFVIQTDGNVKRENGLQQLPSHSLQILFIFIFHSRFHKTHKKRMRICYRTFILWMILYSNEKRMVFNFHHFY